MQYQGGKSRYKNQIVETIRLHHPDEREIWEPFCGGWAVTLELIRAGFFVHASDLHPDLILLGEAIRTASEEELDLILAPVTEATYQAYQHAPSSARRGFVGFGSSFGGSFFGGFGRNRQVELWRPARNFCLKLRAVRDRFDIRRGDYRDLVPSEGLVYADPPYVGTKSYLPDGTAYRRGRFDHKAFWAWARGRTGPTYVSESVGPADVEVVWESERKVKNNSPKLSVQVSAREALFRASGQPCGWWPRAS